MEKIVAPGMHLTACRHTWHRAYVEVVELDAAFRETLEIWRLDPLIAVGGHEMPAERVVHDDDATFFGHVILQSIDSQNVRRLQKMQQP